MVGGSAAQSSTMSTFDATLGVTHIPGDPHFLLSIMFLKVVILHELKVVILHEL